MTMLALHPPSVGAGPPPRIYSGQETARVVGLSWERFRKVRLGWTRDRDFPAEINEPGEPVRYLAEPVDRWLERRTRRVHLIEAGPSGRSHAEPQTAAQDARRHAGRAGRAALSQIKGN